MIKIVIIILRDKSWLFFIEWVCLVLEIVNEKVWSMGFLFYYNIIVNFVDFKCSIEIGMYVKVGFKNCVCVGGGVCMCEFC